MPDDLKAAFPNIGTRPFPLTGRRISPTLKQQLINQYKQLNQPPSPKAPQQNAQNMVIQPPQSPVMTPSQRTQAMILQPQVAGPKPNPGISALSRSGVYARGVEETAGQPSDQQENQSQTGSAETSDIAVMEAGLPESIEPVALTLDHSLHIATAKGTAIELTPGNYEIGSVMGVQLGLVRAGQPTVLVHADVSTHHESIKRSTALLIPSQADGEEHLVLLIPDGTRFDAVGYSSGVTTRSVNRSELLPEKKLKEALIASFAKQKATPPPPCQLNLEETGPRWLPIPCSIPAAQSAPPGGRP